MAAIVTGYPVPTREGVHTLEVPDEDDSMPHEFMYLRVGDMFTTLYTMPETRYTEYALAVATADLGTRRIDVHDKNAWMLQSQLE